MHLVEVEERVEEVTIHHQVVEVEVEMAATIQAVVALEDARAVLVMDGMEQMQLVKSEAKVGLVQHVLTGMEQKAAEAAEAAKTMVQAVAVAEALRVNQEKAARASKAS